MNSEGKLFICLYSDANFFALNILENLLSKNCLVNIVTEDVDGWREKTSHLPNKNRFGLCERKNLDKSQRFDYVIFCGGFLHKEKAAAEYLKMISMLNLRLAKTLVLFPFETFDAKRNSGIKINDNTAVIYLGDLLGPRIDLTSNLFLPQCLSEIIRSRKLTLSADERFYPVFAPDAVRLIIKWLFSFGPYGKELLLLGPDTPAGEFLERNKRLIGEIEPELRDVPTVRVLPRGIEAQRLNRDPSFCLAETYKWINQNWTEYISNAGSLKNVKGFSLHVSTRIPRRTKTAIFLLILILIFPFLTLLAYTGLSLLAYKEFISGKSDFTKNTILIAETFAVTGGKESRVLSYVPLLGRIYKETAYASDMADELSVTATDALPVVRDDTALFNGVLGSGLYDPTPDSLNLGTSLANLYDDTVQIQKLTQAGASQNVVLAKKILARVDLEKFKKTLSEGKILADGLPDILGKTQSKTYLILFENNMEIRPTGGFIGSYGLLTFDGGRLSDLTVSDVYSADGQLNGHVEPPAPIKNYLGEANWWLRDSNWDPDFPTSAQRAEWFLDKEIGKQVDGVAAIDLAPVKEILKYTGPVFLSDYNLDITSDNLYEETQAEVQDNFFPGTHKKASFLTALSGTLLNEVEKLSSQQKLSVLASLYSGLEERHLQVFLHDGVSQSALNIMGWDGSVNIPSCGANCYADLAGIVEANVGVNKSNYFIQRSVSLKVDVSTYTIDRTLTLNLKNTANPGLGPSGNYNDYVRILMPEDANIISIQSISGQNEETLSPEITDVKGRKEVGVDVEVLASETKSIVFSWRTQLPSGLPTASYGLYFRKQAGTDPDPITLDIKPVGAAVNSDPRFTLTRDGSYSYNTTLSQDLFSSFSW